MNFIGSIIYLAAPYLFIYCCRNWLGRVWHERGKSFTARLTSAVAFMAVFFPLFMHVAPVVYVVMDRHSPINVGITGILAWLVLKVCVSSWGATISAEEGIHKKGDSEKLLSTDTPELDLRIAELELRVARLQREKNGGQA